MKKLFTILTAISAFALLPVTSASAHDSHHRDGRIVGYTPCGKPIVAYHEIVGHDHCGRNIWEWVSHYPASCHCRSHPRDYDRDHCDTGRGYHRPSAGWNFFFRF
jgi:hypothetical protein